MKRASRSKTPPPVPLGHSTSQIELPDPSLCPHPTLEATINGAVEMLSFWRSGDPQDLPENPDVLVVMDWLNRISVVGGFERSLEHLSLTHQDVVDTVLQPAENGQLKPLRAAHPRVLLQCLWRIGVQYERCGYDDMRRPIADETFCGVGEFWRELRKKLTWARRGRHWCLRLRGVRAGLLLCDCKNPPEA